MSRRSMRRFLPALFAVALAAFPIAVPTVVSGCSPSDPFVIRHCNFNDNPRVTANRVVTLFAVNYVYVSTRDSEEARHRYVGQAEDVITGAYETTNRILRDDDINLQVVPLPVVGRINEKLDVFDNAGLGGGPDSADIDEMMSVHRQSQDGTRGFNELIAVHWPEWFLNQGNNATQGNGPPPACATVDRCNWVLMSGFIHSPQAVGGTLAHEFGHYFTLDHVTDPANLMCECGLATALTTEQRDLMWAAINTSWRTDLVSETCDLPVTAAPRMPKV
jgi:hypothetical protein